MDIDVDGEMDKDMEEIVKRERLIGQQILLVRMIHVENERGFSFISIGHIAEWMNMSKEEVSQYVDACSALDFNRVCFNAAMEFCEENYLLCDVIKKIYRIYGMSYLGLKYYRKKSNLDPWIQKANKTYREKYDLENNCETVSNEILKEALDYFGKYYISTIIKVKKWGFEWDVIVEMLKNELSKEELLYLRKQIIQRTT